MQVCCLFGFQSLRARCLTGANYYLQMPARAVQVVSDRDQQLVETLAQRLSRYVVEQVVDQAQTATATGASASLVRGDTLILSGHGGS